jgi:hypothetical protein
MLQRRARESGLTQAQIETALDDADPKATLIALMLDLEPVAAAKLQKGPLVEQPDDADTSDKKKKRGRPPSRARSRAASQPRRASAEKSRSRSRAASKTQSGTSDNAERDASRLRQAPVHEKKQRKGSEPQLAQLPKRETRRANRSVKASAQSEAQPRPSTDTNAGGLDAWARTSEKAAPDAGTKGVDQQQILTTKEKDDLQLNIDRLTDAQLDRVLAFLEPDLGTQPGEEIDLDLGKLS